MKRKPTFKDILASEQIVIDEVTSTYGKWFVKFGQGIDVLMALAYLNQKPPSIENNCFQQIVLHDYYQASLSFRACSLLMEHGLYSDAFICLRSLMERLIKNRYFLDYKDIAYLYEVYQNRKLRKKMTLDEKKLVKGISAKKMFDFVSEEGAYEKIYGFLCGFTHKNFGHSTFQLNQQFNASNSLLPKFNKIPSEGLINILLYLLYGYLNLAPSFFEYEWKESDQELLSTYKEIKAFFKDQIIKRRALFPRFHDWDKYMRNIIEIYPENWGD